MENLNKTLEELEQLYKSLVKEIEELDYKRNTKRDEMTKVFQQIKQVKRDLYLSECQFEEGELVILKKGENVGSIFAPKWEPRECYIDRIIVHTNRESGVEFSYILKKKKNDGSMSKHNMRGQRSSFDEFEIEKIK